MNDHTPEQIPVKRCSRCKEWMPATPNCFYRSAGEAGGFHSRCKKCYVANRRKLDPILGPFPLVDKTCTRCGKIKPSTIEFFARRARNSDGLQEKCKECTRRYRDQNSDKLLEIARRWKREHRAAVYEGMRRYRAEHKEKVSVWMKRTVIKRRHKKLEYERNYRIANRSVFTAKEARRRAKKRNAEGVHTAADIERQYKAQRGRCYYCNVKVGKDFHVDHIIPLSRGGSNGPENLVIACPTCNCSKSDKLPHEWEGSSRFL